MAEKEIKIGFPGAKMEALEFFMEKKNETVEGVLREHLDKAYEKYVPQQVREFVESRMQAGGAGETVEGTGINEGESADRTARQRGTRRRSQRQDGGGTQENTGRRARRTQDTAEESVQNVQEQTGQEAVTPDEDMEQAEADGMSMQM